MVCRNRRRQGIEIETSSLADLFEYGCSLLEKSLQLQEACFEFLDITFRKSIKQIIGGLRGNCGGRHAISPLRPCGHDTTIRPASNRGLSPATSVPQRARSWPSPHDDDVRLHVSANPRRCTRRPPSSREGYSLPAQSGPIFRLEPGTLALGRRALRTCGLHAVALDLLASEGRKGRMSDQIEPGKAGEGRAEKGPRGGEEDIAGSDDHRPGSGRTCRTRMRARHACAGAGRA